MGTPRANKIISVDASTASSRRHAVTALIRTARRLVFLVDPAADKFDTKKIMLFNRSTQHADEMFDYFDSVQTQLDDKAEYFSPHVR